MNVQNFTVIESIYGKFIVNRHCMFQAEALIKTGKTHIEEELAKMFIIVDSLPENTILLDGGTNIGFVSIPLAQRIKHKGSRIIGFEPQRLLFYAISGTVALNDLDNVYTQNLALGAEPGFAQLPNIDYSADIDFGSVSIQSQSETKTTVNQVPVITIDSIGLQNLGFLKLDIEGYEINALLGGINTIKATRPWMWIEYNLRGPQYYNEIKKCLIDNGVTDYSYYVMDVQNMLCAPNEKLAALPALVPYLNRPIQ